MRNGKRLRAGGGNTDSPEIGSTTGVWETAKELRGYIETLTGA